MNMKYPSRNEYEISKLKYVFNTYVADILCIRKRIRGSSLKIEGETCSTTN